MEIRYPNYYKKFHCIAGDCPDTCCAGWEIPVDADSEKRYRAAAKSGAIKNKNFARKLKKYVRNGRIISDDVTCPFLNRDGLWEMYMELGADSLCHTCARHPRHLEDYGNLQEMVLLLSCPEAARLILEENDGGFYTRNFPERQGNMEGIDEEFLELLLRMRELIWKTAKEETFLLSHRMAYSLALGHDVQRRIQKEACGEIPEVLERYGRTGAMERFLAQWEQMKDGADTEHVRREQADTENTDTVYTWIGKLLKEFAGLDVICKDWPKWMETVQKNSKRRRTVCTENCRSDRKMEGWKQISGEQLTGDLEAQLEKSWSRIFEYYIYSFLLSALYDEDVLSKIKMAVCCTVCTRELFYACSLQDVETDLADICHAVARQIENSDENRQRLELAMKKEMFESRRIINALLEL